MKVTSIALLAFASAFLGCSRNVAPPKVVEITGDDFMKFNVTSFEAKPGQSVTVRLKKHRRVAQRSGGAQLGVAGKRGLCSEIH